MHQPMNYSGNKIIHVPLKRGQPLYMELFKRFKVVSSLLFQTL